VNSGDLRLSTVTPENEMSLEMLANYGDTSRRIFRRIVQNFPRSRKINVFYSQVVNFN